MSASDADAILGMLTRGRLSVDECDGRRTAFLSHLGSVPKLVPGPWVAHRDLVYAMALANLAPSQRSSLAKAVLVEHGREFGVGRLALCTSASGLPLGGSLLSIKTRGQGPSCLHAWALADGAAASECDWLLLRAQPEWALDRPLREMAPRGLETMVALGGEVVIMVASAVAARQMADHLGSALTFDAHPRFSPHLEAHTAGAKVMLWPQDAVDAPGLRGREVATVVLVGAPEHVRQNVFRWAASRRRLEVVDIACPGRMNRVGLEAFWRACGKPHVMLRGDPEWSKQGGAWLESLGATVEAHARATQLGLF